MFKLNVTKNIDHDKLNKFICKVNIEFENDHFHRFITKERAEKYLHYHIKRSALRAILNKNPYVISIISYKENHNRKDLKQFFFIMNNLILSLWLIETSFMKR